MLRPRIIPVLLIKDGLLYKTKKFKNPQYVGDPINCVKIFNEKQVDELIILDIDASVKNKKIDFELMKDLASETFMPLTYGGGVQSVGDAKKIFSLGVEKIAINTHAIRNPHFITELQKEFGSQSIVIAIDVKKNLFGKYELYSHSGSKKVKKDLISYVESLEKLGAGEILINLINNDGMYCGYDTKLMDLVAKHTSLPVVALGGARDLSDIEEILQSVDAAAAGSMFVFHGKHNAVLITYPKEQEFKNIQQKKDRYAS